MDCLLLLISAFSLPPHSQPPVSVARDSSSRSCENKNSNSMLEVGRKPKHNWIKMILWSLKWEKHFSCCWLAPETNLYPEKNYWTQLPDRQIHFLLRRKVNGLPRSFMLIKQLRQTDTVCFPISVYMWSRHKVRNTFIRWKHLYILHFQTRDFFLCLLFPSHL